MSKFSRQLHKQEYCDKCYYWEKDNYLSRTNDTKIGKCYRYPEVKKEVSGTHWCGEFREDKEH